MPPTLYAHPFSSYCQKVLIALYEGEAPFSYRALDAPGAMQELEALWPLKRFPVLVEEGRAVFEASAIIEHLAVRDAGVARLIPASPAAAVEARMMDRFFDSYVMTPMQRFVLDSLRPAAARDPFGVDEARALLDQAYRWLDGAMAEKTWATGETFTLADCSAAPSLFYADWVHRIPESLSRVVAYRQRLLARPSVKRAVDEARPYRRNFPLGAPDRD